MKLIVGLGNIGEEYERTRHNIGFEAADLIASKIKCGAPKNWGSAFFYEKSVKGHKVIIIKPTTFMNLSGQAVSKYVNKHKIKHEEILVIHDDLDLPLFDVRIKKGGGDGGHNGLKSIMAELNDNNFCRLRIGVGRPEKKSHTVDYVLGPFSEEEEKIFKEKAPVIENFVMDFITMGYEKAAGRFKGV
jgi:peptidyl-tRNA hydrolase, PTH1 family